MVDTVIYRIDVAVHQTIGVQTVSSRHVFHRVALVVSVLVLINVNVGRNTRESIVGKEESEE